MPWALSLPEALPLNYLTYGKLGGCRSCRNYVKGGSYGANGRALMRAQEFRFYVTTDETVSDRGLKLLYILRAVFLQSFLQIRK